MYLKERKEEFHQFDWKFYEFLERKKIIFRLQNPIFKFLIPPHLIPAWIGESCEWKGKNESGVSSIHDTPRARGRNAFSTSGAPIDSHYPRIYRKLP